VPAFGPLARGAWKYAPVVLEAARQVDRKVRPHIRAYQLARSVDGFVGSWTDGEGTHWVVFPSRAGKPLRAFPPLTDAELAVVHRQLDRDKLRSHRELPEEAVRSRAEQAGQLPARLLGRGDGPRDRD
jgi:hypothetical protein